MSCTSLFAHFSRCVIISFVNYLDPVLSMDSKTKFLDLVDGEKYCFKFRGNVKSREWLDLLEDGVLLNRKETNYVVQYFKNSEQEEAHRHHPLDHHARRKKLQLETKVTDFLVHSHRNLEAIVKIAERIGRIMNTMGCSSYDSMVQRQECFSVYFETTQAIPQDHHELIDRLAGGQAYVRTCADASHDKNTEGYTISGPFDVLLRALEPMLDHESITTCSLRIDFPTPDTLGRFVNACQQRAQDYPCTLGMDAAMGRYFCRKTVRDVSGILEYMADFSTNAKISGDFTIFELSSEDEPF